ncbi:hypothetical protein BRW65_22940 [Mycobacterium paraffinicum]|uniref:DUF1643 domain-containing protein n=2 Tax=Mycobacteriaceae TaxID=1762 RepID=A0A1Q4HPE5_9MYCO|nr:hypothetical protein A5689_21230 [Mycobacterium intracellulare subsp. yongonense]OJZ69464.1 hypothetical protein BRW65_22940 [Mycobacterium paraffinicum]
MTLMLDLHLPHWHRPERCAHFSPDRRYRYWLSCRRGPGPALMFISLNPSTADEHRDDATSRRDIGFADGFGYSAVTLTNLYAARATSPKDLAGIADPIGVSSDPRYDNDAQLDAQAAAHDVIVLAWGADADAARARTVASRMWRICRVTGGSLAVLGWTSSGQPRHPLYLRKDTPLQCLTARAHLDMLDVDPRWSALLTDSDVLADLDGVVAP